MDVLIHLGLAAAGIVMLCLGADRLVAGSAALAARFGISGFVIGATVVAYGTSAPELAASVQAAIRAEPGIILGNVIGSNIANIGMVLGVAAVLGVICVGRNIMRREVPVVLAVSMLLLGVSVDSVITWLDGVVLLAGLAAFTTYMLRTPRQTTEMSQRQTAPYRSAGMVVLGAILLYVGAILTVDNSVLVAETFGVPPHIIGIAVIAVGTSLPELITTVSAVRKGRTDIGVANIIGSNILNILLIVGISGIIIDIPVVYDMWVHYAVMFGFAATLFMWWRGRQARWVGPVLVAAYCIYLALGVFVM